MPVSSPQTPLSGPPPPEVPLAEPPLVRVIAQVRFPLIASIEKRDFIAAFQEAVRREYPVLRPEQSRSVVLRTGGVMDAHTSTSWRFLDPSSAWRVTLAPDFLALETSCYTSRDDFLERFRRTLGALEAHVDPKVVDRLGLRYVDRISGPNLDDLSALVRPEVSGILATPLANQARHAVSENVFELPDEAGLVTTRWGLVPPHGTVDPGAVEPIDERSWLLDIDVFESPSSATARPFEVDPIVMQTRAFAERSYSIFRWAVTDEFLRRYGGQP